MHRHGVKLHRMSYNVSHLVIPSIIHAFHGVQDAALHRFQSVIDMGHGSLEDNV